MDSFFSPSRYAGDESRFGMMEGQKKLDRLVVEPEERKRIGEIIRRDLGDGANGIKGKL
jgi:hypothetical protein